MQSIAPIGEEVCYHAPKHPQNDHSARSLCVWRISRRRERRISAVLLRRVEIGRALEYRPEPFVRGIMGLHSMPEHADGKAGLLRDFERYQVESLPYRLIY